MLATNERQRIDSSSLIRYNNPRNISTYIFPVPGSFLVMTVNCKFIIGHNL